MHHAEDVSLVSFKMLFVFIKYILKKPQKTKIIIHLKHFYVKDSVNDFILLRAFLLKQCLHRPAGVALSWMWGYGPRNCWTPEGLGEALIPTLSSLTTGGHMNLI